MTLSPAPVSQLKHVGWITTPLWRCYIDERKISAQQLKEGAALMEKKRQEWEKKKLEDEEKKAKEKEDRMKKSRSSMRNMDV